MKGIAAWIWIVGSLILGLMIFIMGSTLFFNQLEIRLKQSAIDNFYDLTYKIKRTCIEGGLGEVYHYKTFAVPETVKAVYSTNDSEQMPPDKVSLYISDGRSASGKYFCISHFGDDLPICQAVDCSLDVTYMGSPSAKPSIFSMVARLVSEGSVYKTYKYYILINKTNTSVVTAKAMPLVG
jgi:hypothetical protein